MFGLARKAEDHGLDCTKDGVTLAGVPLLRQDEDGPIPRPETEIRRLIGDAYGQQVNFQQLMDGLQAVARAIRAGQTTRALTATVQLGLPALDEGGASRITGADDALKKAGFNPNEPRDRRGRWTTEDGDAGIHTPAAAEGLVIDADHPGAGAIVDIAQGTYHDQLVRNLAEYFRDHGCTVLVEVPLTGINGATARADMIMRGPGQASPDIIEVKTGADPQYTPGQRVVYPLAMVGGHGTSGDARISAVGLVPGQPFPPLPVVEIYQEKPGDPLKTGPLNPEFMP